MYKVFTLKSFILGLPVLLGIFSACTSEYGPLDDDAATTTATLVLSSASNASTKAGEEYVSASAAERTINSGYIGCFDVNGALIQTFDFKSNFVRKSDDSPVYESSSLKLKRDTRRIVVIVNCSENLTGYTTYSQLKKAAISASSFSADNIAKIGELLFTSTPEANKTYNIDLTQLVARVDVAIKVNNTIAKNVISAFIPQYTASQLASWYTNGTLSSNAPTATAVESANSVTITVNDFIRKATISTPSWVFDITSSKVYNANGKSDVLLGDYGSNYDYNDYDIAQSEQAFSWENSTFYTFEKKSGTSSPISFKVTGDLKYSVATKDSTVTSTASFTWNTTTPSGDADAVTYSNTKSAVGESTSSVKNTTTKTFGAKITDGSTTSGLIHGYLYDVTGIITPVSATDVTINWSIISADNITVNATFK